MLGTAAEVPEGPAVEDIVLLEFPSDDEAKAWCRSRAYQAASVHRFREGTIGSIRTDGMSAK